tara:strand:- start:132 stop:407 length:276 start_codon:yes stop_codon:yes gene_type:complete
MQNDLENLLRLLEKSINTHDLSKLQTLEKEIVEISFNIKTSLNSSENINHQLNKDDLEKLKNLIEKISSKQEDKKKFLSDFQNFIKNRKIN